MAYSANRPETHGVFRDWRQIAEGYRPPRLLLGETWVRDLGRLAAFYGHDDELQLAFNFPFVFAALAAGDLSGVVGATLARLPAGACPVWTASNHDVGRFPTRWCGGDERKARLALLVLATLPGTTVLYYGDEIGMTDVAVPPGLRRDKMSRSGGGWDGSRDRARTPMPWDASPSGGFTAAGVTPWLPLGDHAVRNVAVQRGDPGSVLELCRRLLALRRVELGGRIAAYELIAAAAGEGLWAYRVGGLVVAVNLGGQPAALPGPAGEVLLTTGGEEPAAGPAWPAGGCSAPGRASSPGIRRRDVTGWTSGHQLGPQRPDVAGGEPVAGQPAQGPAVALVELVEERGHGLRPRRLLGGREWLSMSDAYVFEARSRARIASMRSALAA